MNDILTESEDLSIVNGDWVVGESTEQHQRALIIDRKGDYKEKPTACVDALSYVDDEGLQLVAGAIAREFAADGMKVESVKIAANGTIETNAIYK